MLSPILFQEIHPVIKNLITQKNLKDLQVAGRLEYFHINWEKLTSNVFIVNLVHGY